MAVAKGRSTILRHEKLMERSFLLMEYDISIRNETGAYLLAGVDEVGRGAMAGPLVAAAVILPERFLINELDDSKVLTPDERAKAAIQIARTAISWSVAFAPPSYIDQAGLTAANMGAMRGAVEGLSIQPDLVLSDGYPIAGYKAANRGVVHGDRLSQAIAAAACLAKVVRDHWMRYLGETHFSGYGWERNAGYSTVEHKQAIVALGATCQHRMLFLRNTLDTNDTPAQTELPLTAS